MTGDSDAGRPPAAGAEPAAGPKRRLYFDLTDGRTLLRDEEGVEVTDLDHALAEAGAVLRELHGYEVGWSLVIRDEAGTVFAQLPVHP